MKSANVEFQAILGLATGLFLGAFSQGLFMTLVFVIFFEYYVWCYTILKNLEESVGDRVLINVVFLFGWVLSRFLFMRETGFEASIENCECFYETFPN